MKKHPLDYLSTEDIHRIIEMAWEDHTTFDAIKMQFGLSEHDVIALMRRELKRNSFKLWRKRVTGRSTKHRALRSFVVGRDHSATQYKHKENKKSKPWITGNRPR